MAVAKPEALYYIFNVGALHISDELDSTKLRPIMSFVSLKAQTSNVVLFAIAGTRTAGDDDEDVLENEVHNKRFRESGSGFELIACRVMRMRLHA